MANQILGKNVVVGINFSGTYRPIFCGKTAEFQLSQDEIETTHIDTGPNREYVPGMSNATLTVTGVSILDNSESRVSLLYLMQQSVRRTVFDMRILFTDQDGDQVAATFNAFYTQGTISRDVTQWSGSNVTFRVTGGITFSTSIPSPGEPMCEEEDPIWTTLAEGAYTITSALLYPGPSQTITILGVMRSGLTYYETTGTPGNLEFTYTTDGSNGIITFRDPGNAGPDLEPVSINYKIETS